jgi:quercetin dioxygenase-like cupin family protein
MIHLNIRDLQPGNGRLLPSLFGAAGIGQGGFHPFQPGEVAHPEPVHIHDVPEVFIVLQGKGILPIDGTDHPIQAGDVIVVEPGEDHHTRSSTDDPLVVAWYLIADQETHPT